MLYKKTNFTSSTSHVGLSSPITPGEITVGTDEILSRQMLMPEEGILYKSVGGTRRIF